MNTTWQRWLGRSLAIAAIFSSSTGAIAASPIMATPKTLPPSSSNVTMVMPHDLEQSTWQLVSYQENDGSTVNAFSDRPAILDFQAG